MIRLVICILVLLCPSIIIDAQELNTKLTINTQKLPAANSQLFSSLESELNQLLNDQRWTSATFSKSERINCNIAITIVAETSENNFAAEIQLTSQRPVYNSSYVTSLMNYRDTQFEFSYMPGLTFDFNTQSVDNNLVAVISFYAYVLIGLDFDSFSLNGGQIYFNKAMEIANMAQSLGAKGWEPFSGKNNNRYDLAVALTEESSKSFHDIWYKYHRQGLDEMSLNASRGRIRVIESVSDIQKLYEARPSSILLSLIRETKVDEIVRVCSQATTEEKQSMKKILYQIFPTKNYSIDMLK
ncbi:DUF4835 family protein [Dysgonomonas sp. Marseille-P4677]|uniref:type IX secretion system protein PorD n=1 Tax=Dysgonomonas sp. Marseille-P4677 TaxID=2364790 RepID=UPI0019133D40|nr:DUF4835 family protein [Dysgonomonas sp. Marseille-P4677]MBK5720310.1 DUF4835 family protein [Dysgonomonas sp. Marseille-P4677]